MQLLTSLTYFSGIVPVGEDCCVFLFFCLGLLFVRAFWPGKGNPSTAEVALQSFSSLQSDFTHRRYEKVLEGWVHLEQHTAEALSLVVAALLALGRPDDIGIFVAKTCANLPKLGPGLHQVVSTMATPGCDVRRQHVLCALRDLHERARDVLDTAAVEQLLLAFAKFNDDARVADLLVDLADESTPPGAELLSKVVRNFLACLNLDAAIGYLQKVLATPSAIKCPPHELIIDVIKVSTQAELTDDLGDTRPKAWDVLDALEDVSITTEAALLFLEWSARQTPVDVAMASRIEELLRAAGPVPMDAYDVLVHIHSRGDATKAFNCFDELVLIATASHPSEASLVGMISSCVEARNSVLAEHILTWACEKDRCTLPVFSATLKVLAASKQAERICAIYELVSSKTELVLDEVLLSQIAQAAVQAGCTELARSLSRAINKPNIQNHISAMRAHAQEGNMEQVLTLLGELQEHGVVETAVYNCALDVCVTRGDAAAVKKLLTEMQASGRIDVASHNILMKQCLSQGASLKAAQDVLREMRRQGLEPNTATYNSMLSCAVQTGDLPGVRQTLGDLEDSGQGADIYTLSILFKGYRRERWTMDAEFIDKAMALIRKHSVKVDETLVHVALEACLALRDTGCLRRSLDTLWSSGWVIPRQASLHTYGLLIKAYGQMQNLTDVWQLWTEVTQEKKMEPSEQLYGQMLDVLVGNNGLEDAITLFQEMKTTHKATLNSQGFAVAYAMIIRGFAQQKDCGRALALYEEMKTQGTRASVVVLNTLMDACSRACDMRAAAKLFKDMEESDCVPDLITYSTLIKGHCFDDNLEEALQLFGLMQEKGIRPDAIVFNSLLDGCAKKQAPALCEQVMKDMEAAGVVPSNHSASIMIKLYGRCKDLDAAFRIINEMPQKYGFRPNNAVYTCLMSACISNGRTEKAMELRLRMVAEGIQPDDRTYSTLLRGALRANSVEQCVLLVNAALNHKGMRASNLLEEDLLRSVLTLIQRQNEWDNHGAELFRSLRESGISVRMPLPPASCNRNDGFGRSQRDNTADAKRNSGDYRGKGAGRDTPAAMGAGKGSGKGYQQQYQQQPQRRY